MNRSRKDVTMLFAIAAMLLFAVFNFVFKPQRSALSDARADLVAVEQDIADVQRSLDVPAVTTPVQVGASASAVPSDPEAAALFRQVNAIAEDAGVTLAAITLSPLGENPSGPGGSLQVSITASGPHAAVLDYVQRLRDSDRLAVVEQVGIGSDGAALTDQLQLSVRVFSLQGPVVPEQAQPTETSAP